MGPSLFAVGVLSVVLVLGNIFAKLLNLLVNHDVPADLLLSVIAYILPFSLTFTIPWGFLTAVLLVFGKMSAENELIALRSSGISVPRVSVCVFILSFFCVGICLWINQEVAPHAQEKMKDALYNIATNNPLSMFGSDKIIDEFPGKKIYVGDNKGSDLYNLLVYEMNEEFEPTRVVHAQHGLLQTDGANQQILLHLYDARFEQRDDNDPGSLNKIRQGITMQETTLPISLKELYEKNKKRRGLGSMTAGEVLERMRNGKGGGGTPQQELEFHTNALTELNKRISFSLASFAFALIGVPLAITAHRKETSIGFVFSLIVAFVYFCFILVADSMRSHPAMHPELLVWSPNVLFIAIGAVLFYRLGRR